VAVFEGVKVLELGAGAAGPVATRYFADHGATVVRIESSRRPDFLRILFLTPGNPFGLDGSPMFVLMNPNKKSVAVDMSKPEGVEVVRRLVDWADVVSENFSPKAMAKWGLDYESLRERKPDLLMVSSCLFGQTGPQRMYPGFGGQGSALSGFNQMAGWPDREAVGPHATITDSLSPRYVAFLIAAALLHRRRTGEGQYIDVSQIETGVYSLSEMMVRFSATG
jgi:benzylsuccinate CoA-transferase BbsF subunit